MASIITVWVSLIALLRARPISAISGFERDPGILKVDPGATAYLVWTLTDNFQPNRNGARMRVIKSDTPLLPVVNYENGECETQQSDARESCVVPENRGKTVGLYINDISVDDAHQYTMLLRHSLEVNEITNDNAWIYIFKPASVMISGTTAVLAGEDITLHCSAVSQSAPRDETVSVIFEYSWSHPEYVINSTTVRIPSASRDNHEDVLTCTVNEVNSTTVGTASVSIDIQFSPENLRLSHGDQTETAVAGQTERVTRTCVADCNPECTYSWDGAPGDRLAIHPVEKSNHRTYTCVASNIHKPGGIRIEFTLIVNFSPDIMTFTSSVDTPNQNTTIAITCDVDSRPVSDITIEYKNNGTVLTSVVGVRAEYNFPSLQCLDTGTYQCTANNGIGPGDVILEYMLNVTCPFSPVNVEDNIGQSLWSNFTFNQTLTANPFSDIGPENWSFENNNGTIVMLPDNAEVMVSPTGHPVQNVVQLNIQTIEEYNYGEYRMQVGNSFGPPAVIHIEILPEGPPTAPFGLTLAYATPLSLNICWISGFNGGFQQTFTVLYTDQTTGSMYEQVVNDDTSYNTGDIARYMLTEDITPATTYTVRIQAANLFNGGSDVIGDPANFTTDPEVRLSSEDTPDFTVSGGDVIIALDIVNSEYLSSIEAMVCATDPADVCETSTTTDVSSGQISVTLPESNSNEFNISVSLYDNDDLVYNKQWTVTINGNTVNIGRIVGGAVGGLAAAAVIIAIVIVLWRKGILPLKRNKSNGAERSTAKDEKEQYANEINQYELEQEVDDNTPPADRVPGSEKGFEKNVYADVKKVKSPGKVQLPAVVGHHGKGGPSKAKTKGTTDKFTGQYINVTKGHNTEGPYANVDLSNDQRKLPMVGEDGITYADLAMMHPPAELPSGYPPPPVVIHGVNDTVYTSIDVNKTRAKAKGK